MANLIATKSNLLALKRSKSLAHMGFELMDRKRNILIREMMSMMDTAEEIQSKIDETFATAYAALQKANIIIGTFSTLAMAVPVDDTVEIKSRTVMGVDLPIVPPATSHAAAMPYGFTQTDASLDEAFLCFVRVKGLVRMIAEVENSVYRLAISIRKTQKRANALQNIIIPGLDRQIAEMADALEEKDREEFVRLKEIKRMHLKRQKVKELYQQKS